MASQEERKAELERKKQRLAEIREEKKRREDEKRRKLLEHQPDQQGGAAAATVPSQVEVEQILTSVGISPHAASLSPDRDRGLSAERDHARLSVSPSPARPAGSQSMCKSQMVQVDIAPKEQVAYCKTTQTDTEGGGGEFHAGSVDWWEDEGAMGGGGGSGGGGRGSADTDSEVFGLDESPTHQLANLLPHISLVQPAEVRGQASAEEAQERRPPPELTEEERQQIVSSTDFQQFFERASRVVERAVTEKVDIFVDYARAADDDAAAAAAESGARLSVARRFESERWTQGRCVTCLDYSPQHAELLAASYAQNEAAPHEPDGVVLVWNAKFRKDTPEYTFHSQSRVTSVAFGRFHPNLILGGTYSGQISLWDNRQNKKTPVQRSPLSTSAHTHPVYSIQVVGSQNAHNLISVSTDGRVCAWSLDMLAQPQEVLDLSWKQSKQVAVTSMSFPPNDVNNFIAGGEDGMVYAGCRHGNRAGITECYEGHFAPITGVACHSASGSVDFSHLFVTSSFDWTVRLWDSKEPRALHVFDDHNDYVFDAAWSPTQPALFGCVDGSGRVDLWHLNRDTEQPAASLVIEGRPALNKIVWMPGGQQLAVGDDAGGVWLLDVHESLATAKSDEWERLRGTLADIRAAQLEADQLNQAFGGH